MEENKVRIFAYFYKKVLDKKKDGRYNAYIIQ